MGRIIIANTHVLIGQAQYAIVFQKKFECACYAGLYVSVAYRSMFPGCVMGGQLIGFEVDEGVVLIFIA